MRGPFPVRLLPHLPEKKKGRVHDDRGGGRDAPARVIGRPAIFTGMRPGLPWPLRGFDGDVGWKASRCAISWAPAGRCRRSRGGMAFQDLVNREASPSFCSSAAASTLFQYPFPECPDSWIAPGVGCRDEAAPRGCFDLPVEQRNQRAPFHLPRDHPRVSHSRPHALHGGVDHHAVEAEARRPRQVRRRFALAREPVRPVGVPSEIVQQGPVMQLDRIAGPSARLDKGRTADRKQILLVQRLLEQTLRARGRCRGSFRDSSSGRELRSIARVLSV